MTIGKGKYYGIGKDPVGERVSDACDTQDAINASRRGFGEIKLYEYENGKIGKLKKVVLPVPKRGKR